MEATVRNRNLDDFEPIVLGGDILGYSYVREFARIYRKKTHVIGSADVKMTSTSRFCEHEVIHDIDQPVVMMDWLRKHRGDFKTTPLVLGAASDWHVRALSQNKEELTELGYVVPYIDFDLLDRITQKDQFYAACDSLGIPYPKTFLVPFGEYDDSVIDGTDMRVVTDVDEIELEYPVIAKPSNSADWHYAEVVDKHKVYKVASKEELETIIERVGASSYSHALLIQEMLSDSDESLHTLTTFSDERGTMLVGVSGDVLVQDRTPAGIGNPVTILGTNRRVDLLLSASKLLAKFGYEGYANFDVMDGKDGVPRFLEVNTRPGRNTYYVSLAGCPFVRPIVEHYVRHNDIEKTLSHAELAAADDFLFTVLPKQVIMKETKNPDSRAEVERIFKLGRWGSPMLNSDDSIQQRFWSNVNFQHARLKY